MAQQTRRLRYKWHDFALYQLCRMVVDDNVQSLSGMSAFDDICLLRHVATAIDELRSYPQEAHAMLLAFGGRLYQDLRRDNPNATETELRRATIFTGLTLALCLNCHKDTAVTAATAWLSKGLQSYGDVMAATGRMMSSVDDALIDNISEWINSYWESDERLIDEDGNFVVDEERKTDLSTKPGELVGGQFGAGATQVNIITPDALGAARRAGLLGTANDERNT